PSSYEELGAMLDTALSLTGPSAIRWPKTEAPRTGRVGNGLSARRLRSAPEGGPGRRPDVCLLGVGKMVAACEEAAARLEPLGVEATVWDVRVAAPLDGSMVADAARHRLVLSAEDGIADGGVGASIATAVRGVASGGDGPLTLSMGLPGTFLPHGRAADILADAGLDGAGLAAVVLATLPPATDPEPDTARLTD
ncbi:MAG: transketolase C-terminal domain-containing protein, partial [Acidimicrobiales bacterium]